MNQFAPRLFPLLLSVLTLPAFAVEVDKAHSEIHFSVAHMVVARTKGEFTDFTATVKVENDQLVSAVAEIPVASIDTSNEKRDAHLKNADFFDAEQFPVIRFESTKVEKDKLHGKLTIKGITKDVVLDLEFLGPVQDPWGKIRYGLNLQGEINRTEFGLTWNKALEAGGAVVGETVKLDISIELMK